MDLVHVNGFRMSAVLIIKGCVFDGFSLLKSIHWGAIQLIWWQEVFRICRVLGHIVDVFKIIFSVRQLYSHILRRRTKFVNTVSNSTRHVGAYYHIGALLTGVEVPGEDGVASCSNRVHPKPAVRFRKTGRRHFERYQSRLEFNLRFVHFMYPYSKLTLNQSVIPTMKKSRQVDFSFKSFGKYGIVLFLWSGHKHSVAVYGINAIQDAYPYNTDPPLQTFPGVLQYTKNRLAFKRGGPIL